MQDTGHIVDILQSVLDEHESQYQGERLYEPIPPADFFLSEYHSGMPRAMIPKFWLEEAVDFIEGGYNELIITGSLGSYKTTWANLIQLYKLYELFSYRSIHHYLSLPEMQDVYSLYFSVAMQQAKLTGYKQFKSMIDASDWFKANFPRNQKLNSMIEFPRNSKFSMLLGSGEQHAIGMTVWSFILDEGDFFKKNAKGFDDSYDQVTAMYDELVDRRLSRMLQNGKDYSFSILISSASFQSSFVSKRIDDVLTDETSNAKVVKAIKYKIEEHKYSPKKFVVFTGDTIIDPELIDKNESYPTILQKLDSEHRIDPKKTVLQNYAELPPSIKIKFETPPVDLQRRYEKNLFKSLMNFSGVAVASIGKLLQSKDVLLNSYRQNLMHPFTKQRVELSTGDDYQLKDYFIPRMLMHLSRPHAIHIDGSLTGDSTGISMVRFDGKFKDSETSIVTREYTHVFSLEIIPPPAPYQIKLSKVRNFVLYLYKELGVNVVKVTQDQYQSADSLQLMADEGLTTGRQSIDKTDDPYMSWISLMMDNCMNMYKYQILENEAFAALHDRKRKKVDHPKKGEVNINVLQSFVGALNNLIDKDVHSVNTGDVMPAGARKHTKRQEANALLPSVKYTNNIVGAMNNAHKQQNLYKIILGS